MKKKIIISILILVVAASIILWYTRSNATKNNNQQFKVEEVHRGDIEALVVTTGTLNPVKIVDVGSQVSGRIKNIYVDFNSKVKQGQVIAELDQEFFFTRVKQNEANFQSAKASLEKTKVNLQNIKKQYERALELFEKNLISFETKENSETLYYSAKADVQSAEAGIKQAESQLESGKVDLEYTVIKSPIDGIVINRNINVGQTVAASFQAPVLFQIADKLDKMQVECSVDEADIGKVQEDQKVRFTVDAFPDENFSGRVIQVRYSPVTVQNVVTYTTIVQVDNPELKLRPGMTANASIVVGQASNVLLVSNAALRFTPQLSAEEMKAIFEANHKEDSGSGASGGPPAEQHRPLSGGNAPGQMHGVKPKNISRVWIIDEPGKLKPLFLKAGVTDNTYTEVLQGNLKEGQKVIIGMESESTGGGPGASSVRGMMRVMH